MPEESSHEADASTDAAFQVNQPGPLTGVRVVDLGRVVSAGHCTTVLGDLGADVIKVERPDEGDELRGATSGQDFSPYFQVYGRNKRSMVVDLKESVGVELLLKLVAESDVFVENFRPGTIEKLGIGPDVLLRHNPALVIVRISGWGQTGPYADRPGFGTLAEAVSGFMLRNGYGDLPPVPAPTALADMVAGLYAACSAVAAIVDVRAGGAGQVVDVSLFEPLFSMMGPDPLLSQLGGVPTRGEGTRASSIKGTFRCADGKWVAISAGTESTVRRLLASVERLDLLDDEKFATYEARLDHQDEMNAILQTYLGAIEREEVLVRLHADDVTVAPLYDVYDCLADEHFQKRGTVIEVPSRVPGLSSLKMHSVVPRMSATPSGVRMPAPRLGEHTREILSDLGYAHDEIQQMAQGGIIQMEE